MTFEWDWLAVLLAVIFVVIFLYLLNWKKQFDPPYLFFSDTRHLRESRQIEWSPVFYSAALAAFLLAFIDPHLFFPRKDISTHEGIALYLVLDQSGSMREDVQTGSNKISKIAFLKELTEDFVKERPNDLIGLVSFARTAQVLVPLTISHDEILEKLRQLDVVKTEEEDGTAIGYAVYKTANLIAATRHYAQDLSGSDIPAYTLTSFVMILVTDGFPSPSPLDKQDSLRRMDPMRAAEYAKEKGVKLYIITIDPLLGNAELAPQRHLMQRMAEWTGGKYYLIDDSMNLKKVYDDINGLEKSAFPKEQFISLPKDKQPHRYHRFSLYPFFISLGLVSWLLAILCETLIWRRVP